MKNIIGDLKFALNPKFFLMKYPYDKDFDRFIEKEFLNKLDEWRRILINLDNHKLSLSIVNSDMVELWILDYPYNYGVSATSNNINCRPSKRNIKEIKDSLKVMKTISFTEKVEHKTGIKKSNFFSEKTFNMANL